MEDNDIEVATTTEQIQTEISPSHKITISQGSDKYVYWYVKGSSDQEDFDKSKNRKLVENMHAKGIEMNIGFFVSFNLDHTKDYHLERLSSHEFVIKRLK